MISKTFILDEMKIYSVSLAVIYTVCTPGRNQLMIYVY